MGVLTLCHPSSLALAQPPLGLPPEALENLGWCCPSHLQRSAALGGLARRPGAFAQDASGMGVPGLRNRSLVAPRPRGICCRDQPQALHPCAWVIKTGESANCGPQGEGYSAWDTPESLEGVNHRRQARLCERPCR